MILTFQCTQRVETSDYIEYTLSRTLWSISDGSDEDGDEKFETVDWDTEGAQPFVADGTVTFREWDDEYEVGRHYAFTSDGPIELREDADE